MLIGAISDTHDNLNEIRKAVDVFNSEEVEHVLHAGDLISPFTAALFKELDCPFTAVFGNNDGDRRTLWKKYHDLCELKDLQEIQLSGKNICVYHGHIEQITSALRKSKQYDLIVTGHNHSAKVEKTDHGLHVNPGECCGYVSGKKSIALIDLNLMDAEIREL